MRTETERNQAIAYLEGRITSANAEEILHDLSRIITENPGRELIIDAGNLEYISSAGLRVLLQISRKQGDTLTVRNVSPDVYNIFDMTGFASILNIKKKLREFSIDGCEIVGRGAVGTVYRVDEDTIVKVYELPDSIAMIENEQKRAKQAFLKGIPTAISYDVVKVGDQYGSVFEMLKAENYNDALRDAPEKKDEFVRKYAYLIRQIHAVEMERGELPEAKNIFMEYLKNLRQILPDDLYSRLYNLLQAMPENLHAIHGDIQMKNIMLNGDEPLLIDMETLSVGDPVFDLQGLFVTYQIFNEDEPGNTLAFLGLSKELADFIWKKTLEYYFDNREETAIQKAKEKIQIVAYIRFLYLIYVLEIGKKDLKRIRIEHALERLKALAGRVDSLEIGSV